MLALLSTATHLATLLALVQDYKRDWVLRWLRQLFMFINLVLNVLYGVFMLQSVLQDLAPTLPIACVWQEHADDQGVRPSKSLSIIGTIAVIAVTVILFALATWYLVSMNRSSFSSMLVHADTRSPLQHMRRQRWGRAVRSVGVLLLVVMAVGAAVRVIVGGPSMNITECTKADFLIADRWFPMLSGRLQ